MILVLITTPINVGILSEVTPASVESAIESGYRYAHAAVVRALSSKAIMFLIGQWLLHVNDNPLLGKCHF